MSRPLPLSSGSHKSSYISIMIAKFSPFPAPRKTAYSHLAGRKVCRKRLDVRRSIHSRAPVYYENVIGTLRERETERRYKVIMRRKTSDRNVGLRHSNHSFSSVFAPLSLLLLPTFPTSVNFQRILPLLFARIIHIIRQVRLPVPTIPSHRKFDVFHLRRRIEKARYM